ncbi:MAG: ribosome silencing factor [Pseudomonadota bacterium]|nr:ribosome silencing factor [Pseudomonadota bacterium]
MKSKTLKNKTSFAETENFLELVKKTLDEDKAEDVVIINLEGKTDIADFMLIASGSSRRHVGSMADHIQRKLKTNGLKDIKVEGLDYCDWVLIDGGSIIIHLFRPDVRVFYNLEKMWERSLDQITPVSPESALA